MFTVGIEDDKVILHLDGRKRDVMISCVEADKLVVALRHAASKVKTIRTVTTEIWDCKVESYDGVVAMRFCGPQVGYPKVVPLPPDIALKLADLVEFKGQQARHKMRFVFQ